MATKATTDAGGFPKNNGSTIVNAGNVPATKTTINNAGLGTVIGVQSKGTPTVQPQTGTTGHFSSPGLGGRTTAKGSGTFAYNMKAGKFIGIRLSDELNGVANTALLSGGVGEGRYNGTIHSLEKYYTLPKYTFNPDGSRASTTSAGGSATNYIDSAGNGSAASADSAANVTRAIPGALVYTDHGLATTGALAVPVTREDGTVGADYKPKTG